MELVTVSYSIIPRWDYLFSHYSTLKREGWAVYVDSIYIYICDQSRERGTEGGIDDSQPIYCPKCTSITGSMLFVI